MSKDKNVDVIVFDGYLNYFAKGSQVNRLRQAMKSGKILS